MSSSLKKKSKIKQPAGYSKTSKLTKNSISAALIEETFYNIRLISYQILHDKCDFTREDIIRTERTTNKYLSSIADKEMSVEALDFYLKETANIDVKSEVNKIPFNERFFLVSLKVEAQYKPFAGMHILSSSYNYLVLLGVCLKTQFNFPTEKILKVYDKIRDYINTLSRYKQFELKIEDIAICLAEEINYCDDWHMKKIPQLQEMEQITNESKS